MLDPSPAKFYDELADFYHLSYADWQGSVERQALALDSLLRSRGVTPPAAILDAACGVGTQTLGLASLGYDVTGSDISAGAVTRAKAEATARGLMIDFSVADMREVAGHHCRTFDAVLACDNSVPHLLSDEDILTAFRAFHACTAPGGVCVISVRDYAVEPSEGLHVRPPLIHESDRGQSILFQTWKFDAPPIYLLSLYVVEDCPESEPVARVMRARYYAVTTDVLLGLMAEAGFQKPERVDGVFFQPVLIGRRDPQA